MSAFAVNDKTLPLVLTRRAKLIGLPRSITAPVITDFCRWYRCNGADWTVARTKNIKQLVLNSVAGCTQVPKDIWIRHSNGLLKGHYGELQRRALSSNRQLKKVLSFLNLYTVMVEFSTTKASIQKFRQVVETPGPDVPSYLLDRVQQEVKILASEYNFDTSDVSYATHYEQAAVGKKHQEEDFTSTIEQFFRTATGRRLIIDFPCVYQPLVNLLGFRGYQYVDAPEVMGRVFRIPSPGLKDRWVCDFNKALDHCLKPMGRRIYDTVATLPWDITFDEGKCLDKIQSRLKNGQVAYSFDLSSATDRFPWTLQHVALQAFSTGEKFQEMVSLYNTLIHMPALMPDGTQITWVQGQPLGAFPSFATFTFTHGVLLHMLLRATGRSYDGQFFVHGDDVVVLDDALAILYKKVMVMLEVPLSPFKTLQSNKVAEINSKVITAEHVLTIPKWKPITRHNTLGQIKNWGLGVIKFLKLNKEESEAYIRLASLPVALGGAFGYR